MMLIDQCGEIFNEKADIEAKMVINLNGKLTSGKELLFKILWNQSVQSTKDARDKGKKQVWYHPIMIRFVIMIPSNLNRGTYQFLSQTFNLPSSRSVSNYDLVDVYSKDGVYGVLKLMSQQLDNVNTNEWRRVRSLAFDSTWIKANVKFDPHSKELVGFEEGALKEDVLLKELAGLDVESSNPNAKKSPRLDLSQQFPIFIYTSWDVENTKIKSVVAH